MLRQFLRLGCAPALAVGLAVAAQADLTATVLFADHYGSGPGGEFLLTPSGLPFTPMSIDGDGSFESFCIEKNEHVSYGQTYFVQVNTQAINGGAGGGNPDPLSPLTAYLYGEFIEGSLAGYAYDVLGTGGLASRVASANALQDVIWYLEDEQPRNWTPGDSSLRDQFYQNALANAGDDIGDVRVLNMFRDRQGHDDAQDQLIRIPEPSSLGLLIVAALGLGLRRR